MKTRKALGIVAVSIFALALAACSNSATDDGTGGSANPSDRKSVV